MVYGRKMMKGYLESQGMKIGEHSIGASLKRVAPESHEGRRQDTNQQV